MKSKLQAFTESYHTALHRYCRQRSITAGLAEANQLGTRASKLGIVTKDLVDLHQEALLAVEPESEEGTASDFELQQGALFFAEAASAMDVAAEEPKSTTVRLRSIIKVLSERTKELAASNENLETEISCREKVEDALRLSEQTSSKLLLHSKRLQEELRQFSRRLLLLQEEERKRISRELHDVVAQALAALHVRLSSVKVQTTANAKDLQKQIAATQRLVRDSVDVVQRFAQELRPAALDDLGLLPALRSYVRGIELETGVEMGVKSSQTVEKLAVEEKTVLYRIVQESICNILQHAKATKVSILFTHNAKLLTMKIHDNGIGFQVERCSSVKNHAHLGLLGMRERVEMVNGTFCIDSAPGKETTIQVTLPFPDRNSGTPKVGSSAESTFACS